MARDLPGLVERTSTRFAADYVLAAAATAALLASLLVAGHLDPVGDATSRRVVYGLAGAGALGLAWAVYTWINATYSDSSARMVKVRARQGSAIRVVRYHLITECIILAVISVGAVLVDMDATWRVYVFYVWVLAALAVGVGLWRVLRLQWRLHEIRELDDQAADRPSKVPDTITWRKSA